MKPLIVLFLFLTGCAGSGGGNPNQQLVPVTPGGGGLITPPVQTYSVFQNFGAITGVMPLDFTGYQIGVGQIRLYYQYADGSIHTNVSFDSLNPEVRRCRDTVTFTGTESDATMTITDAQIGWAQDTNEYANDTHCAVNNGVYHAFADQNGLWMGLVGSEQNYQAVP